MISKNLTTLVAAGALCVPAVSDAATYNFDLNRSGDNLYVGTALASDTGTTWNEIVSGASMSVTNALDSEGGASSVGMTVTPFGGDMTARAWSNNSNGNPTPVDLMSEYLYPGNGTQYSVAFTGLAPGAYNVYVYAHGDQPNQFSAITMDAANGGASGTTGETGTNWRDINSADGPAAVQLAATVGAGGTLTFTTGYLNGVQLQQVPEPSVALLGALGVLGLARRRR